MKKNSNRTSILFKSYDYGSASTNEKIKLEQIIEAIKHRQIIKIGFGENNIEIIHPLLVGVLDTKHQSQNLSTIHLLCFISEINYTRYYTPPEGIYFKNYSLDSFKIIEITQEKFDTELSKEHKLVDEFYNYFESIFD